MLSRSRAVLMVLVIASMTSCSSQQSPTVAASDSSADRQQIEAAAGRIWSAVAHNDAAAVLAEYADDSMILGGGSPAVKGKPAVAAALSGLFGSLSFRDVVGSPTDIAVSGDLAVETGTYAWTIVPTGGNPSDDKGKYLHVWARTPAGWKVTRYMANSDMPSP